MFNLNHVHPGVDVLNGSPLNVSCKADCSNWKLSSQCDLLPVIILSMRSTVEGKYF